MKKFWKTFGLEKSIRGQYGQAEEKAEF
jgi:hypothetical protein